MIRLTENTRKGDHHPLYVNPRYIRRISVPMVPTSACAVVDIDGIEHSSWVLETPDQIFDLIREQTNADTG
jgi:hypothetical protein